MAIVVPFIGAAIGNAAISGTILGLSGGAFGWLAGSLLSSLIFKPPAQQGPRLEDLTIVGTDYGQAIPWVAGSPRLAPQYVWVSRLREIANTQKVGKGGGQKVTTYTYECDVMLMLTENVTEGVARDWINAELVRNGITLKRGIWDGITVYRGDEDQLPDPTYEAAVGAGNAPAYRGHTTIIIRGLQLGGGKQLPNIEHQPSIGTARIELDDFFNGSTVVRAAPDFISASAASPETDDSFLMSIGRWSNSYSTTTTEVWRYTFSTDTWTEVGTFNVVQALENCSKGNADAPYRVAIGSHSTTGRIYLLPSGSRRFITRGAEAGSVASQNVVYLIEGGTIWHAVDTSSARIYRNSLSSTDSLNPAPIEATSSPITGVMNGMAVRRNQLYVATGGGGNIQVYDKDSLAFVKTIATGFEGGGMVIGSVEGKIVAVCRDGSGPYTYPVFTLGDDDEVIPIGFATSDDVELAGGGSARGLNGNRGAVVITDYSSTSSPRVYTIRVAEVLRTGTAYGRAQPLNETLAGLLRRAGYQDDEFDVQGLDAIDVYGYSTASVTSTRAHLETLRPYGLYEANCSDKLNIFPRATVPAGSIPWDDLGASESPGEPSDPFPLQVGNEVEVPAQIAVRYRNVAANWNTGTEFSDRLVSSQVSTQTIDMPFGLTPQDAKRIADVILKDAMAGLGRATLRIGGRKHARYEPGDILTTTAPNGTSYRFRIVAKRDFIFMLEWDVALDDASALDSTAITETGYISTDEPVNVPDTLWEVLPIRPLRDADASVPGPYVAMTPDKVSDDDEWPGGVFVRARLPEAYEQVFISGDQCVMGTCLTTLGDFSGGSGQVQRTGKLRVRVLGELSSAAYYDFFTDRTINAAVVGNEPIRFMTAEFIENDGVYKVYDLYNFLRGQLGMEDQIAGHVSSERFVLLNNAIRRMVNETTDIDAEQQVKAATLNFRLDDVTEESFTDDGIALRPLAPVRLLAVVDAGDIDFSWIRRSRLIARWAAGGVIAPLGETTEAYRVKVYDNPASDPVRTVDVAAQAWTYTAADQATDGFTSGDPITLTVQQLSDLVGEGDAVTLETEAP